MWCMAWFMTTKVVPQHRETPVSSPKHQSVFCSWEKTKQNKETSLTSTKGWKRSSGLTLAYTASLYFSLTHSHRNRHQIHSHIFSNNIHLDTYIQTHLLDMYWQLCNLRVIKPNSPQRPNPEKSYRSQNSLISGCRSFLWSLLCFKC